MAKLFVLSANPNDCPLLRLHREMRQIEETLATTRTHCLVVKPHQAVRVQDLPRLLSEKPSIVHFCGHCSEYGELLLEDAGGNSKPVRIDAVRDLFARYSDSVKCVILNACYSETLAGELSKHIKCVVG